MQKLLTGISWGRIAEFVSVAGCRPDAQMAARDTGPFFEDELRLHGVGVRVASVPDVVNCTRITALRHEHFGGVVRGRVLVRPLAGVH